MNFKWFALAFSVSFLSVYFFSEPTVRWQHHKTEKMGTYLKVSLPVDNFDQYKKSLELVDRLESELSHYKPESALSRLVAEGKACVSEDFKSLVASSEKAYSATAGKFDMFYKSRDKNPVLTKTECGLALKPVGAQFDFGAIGKGYTVDRMRSFFVENQIKHSKIAFSGDITCVHKGCKIGVQNPFVENEETLFTFKSLKHNISVSTSGEYRRGEHIKGRANKQFVSVTLIGEANNTLLDALTTAAFLSTASELEQLSSSNNFAYMILTKDKTLTISKNYGNFIEDLDLNDIPKSIKIVNKAP